MHSYNKSSQLLAIGLSALAGYVDAVGFIKLGGLFVSFMSGNSTRFGVGVMETGSVTVALMPLAIIALFVIGVMMGKVVRRLGAKSPLATVLGFMLVLLALAAVLPQFSIHAFSIHAFSIPLMIFAMGAANNVFVREGEVVIGVTYMTGTLVKLGQRLAGAMLKETDSMWLPYLLLWGGLIAGAVSGAVAFSALGMGSLWIAAAFCLALTIFARYLDARE